MVDGAAPAIEGGNLALQEREAKSLIYRTVIFCSMTSMLLGRSGFRVETRERVIEKIYNLISVDGVDTTSGLWPGRCPI
eukprot:1379498-Amorphochlora_amoeboformis.AAC.2